MNEDWILIKNKDLPQLFFLWRCSTHYMRTTLYLYSHTQQSAILSSSSSWHHTKIRRFTMVCRSPHVLFSVRCYKKAIEKNSCVFSGPSMWKIAKKTEIGKASMKLGQTPWTFPPHQQRMRMQNAILLYKQQFLHSGWLKTCQLSQISGISSVPRWTTFDLFFLSHYQR